MNPQLEGLLRACTVKISIPTGWGTGFFVAPGLILTCAHVVRDAPDQQVTVFWPFQNQARSGTVQEIFDDGKTLDIALLALAEPWPNHPCVLLDEASVAIGQQLYSYGYLKAYSPNAAPVLGKYEGLTDHTPPLLKFQDCNIEKGISGAALVNLNTDKVCGMVRESRDVNLPMGGGAVPTPIILEKIPWLKERQKIFHQQDTYWTDLISVIGGGVNAGAQPPPSQRSQKAHPETEAQLIRAKLLRRLKEDIDRRVEYSLHKGVKIDLRLEDQRQRVGKHKLELVPEDTDDTRAEASRSFTNRVFQPLGTQDTPATPLEATQSLLPILKRSDVQHRLLILGEPGAGKTTELVALAYDLLVQAEQNEYSPIPIIFELSAWQENIPIEQWIVARIKKIYKIPESISRQWIDDEQLIPLLDGLDELGLVKQKQCVMAINQFLEEKIYPYTVVCCRREEYEKGQAELSQLRGAVYLQPLTNEQIQGYLRDLNRFSLWSSISASPELLDLSRRPLFLTMVVGAYQGQSIRNESDLFNVYIKEQLQEPNHQGAYPPGKAPSQQKTLHYLSWLARQLEDLKEPDFLIEEMQPSWLSSAYRHSYRLMVWLIVGLIVGLMCDLALWPILLPVNFGLILGPIVGIILVSISVLMNGGALLGGIEEIEPIERLVWLNWGGMIFRLIFGLMIGLMIGLLRFGLMVWLIYGLGIGLVSLLINGLSWVRLEEKHFPNQGIKNSRQIALVVTLYTLSLWLICFLTLGSIDRLSLGLTFRLTFGLTFGLSLGLMFGVVFGLKAVIQHYTLRFLLAQEGSFPWDCIRFLDHAARHRFIQPVGGRYRFIHGLLRKHFAYGELPDVSSR